MKKPAVNKSKTTVCPTCHKTFKSLGFASHRAKHFRDKKKNSKALAKPTTQKVDLSALSEAFKGDLDLMLFYITWIKNGLNAEKAYKELHPKVDQHSAATLGSRLLKKVDLTLVMKSYGLDEESYFKQLKDGMAANKQISGIIIGGEVKKQPKGKEKEPILIEVPDHATRKGYHDKLGKLLGFERGNDSSISLSQDNRTINIIFKREEEK